MDKIALITFQRAYNYGGTLQAFAMQEKLKDICKDKYTVEIIDYWPNYWSKKTLKRSIKNFLLYKKKSKFKNFQENKLNLTKMLKNKKQVESISKKYSLFIIGSDQVWNPNITGNAIDQVFFLNFPHPRKISYASSLGSYIYNKDEEKKVSKFLSEYKSISTRETSSSSYLAKVIKKDVDTVLDPSLLLNNEEWKALLSNKRINKQKYLLVYNLGKEKNVFHIAEYCSKKLNLQIVNIGRVNISGYKNYNSIGPLEFVSLIDQAELVVTNSFHGTAFAVNLNKDFYSILHKTMPDRARDLLTSLSLEHRLVENIESIDFKKIDYNIPNARLKDLREYSEAYLRRNI